MPLVTIREVCKKGAKQELPSDSLTTSKPGEIWEWTTKVSYIHVSPSLYP